MLVRVTDSAALRVCEGNDLLILSGVMPQVNVLDIAPLNSSFVHSIMNMFGQLTGWVAPIALAWMTQWAPH